MTGRYKAYPEYNASGAEWLPELPANWKIERTKRMFSLKRSLVGNQSSNYQLLSLTLKGVIPRDVSSGEGKIPESFDTYQKVDKCDLIFCLFDIDETPRTIGISPLNGMITGAYNVYSCLDSCHSDYAYYYFYHIDSFKGLKPFYTGLRKVVRAETFSNIEMPCPSFEEQQKIANFLDYETAKIDTLIAKQEKLIELLKEKRQAVISHAVTKGLNPDAPMKDSGVEWLGKVPEHWELWKFGHFAPIITCGVASTPTYVDESEGMPFLSAQNIQNNKLSLHKYNYIPYELHQQLTKYRKPERGDLLVTRVGAGIGAACVIDIDMEFSIYVSLTHIRVKPEIADNKFITYFFGSDYCDFLNHDGTVTGGGVGNLNVQNVVRYKVPLPPLEEQRNIVAYIEQIVSKIDGLIEKAEKAISLATERKTALISAAVTGKIDVRDWKKGIYNNE